MVLSHSGPRFKTASDYVCFQLRQWIIEGHLKSGQKIDQQDIARRLDASRMPVRTALERLAAQGLVVVEAHRGAIVAPITASEVNEIYALRIHLEPWAIHLAAHNLTASSFQEADRLIKNGTEALKARQWAAYLESNEAFYALLWHSTGNVLLCELLRQLFARALRYRWIYVRKDGRKALATTADVLTSLKSGRRKEAADSLAASLADARERLLHEIEMAEEAEETA
jgi:DNA-binding GntR family transcriptional regulator